VLNPGFSTAIFSMEFTNGSVVLSVCCVQNPSYPMGIPGSRMCFNFSSRH
jgi:hypothetical protein